MQAGQKRKGSRLRFVRVMICTQHMLLPLEILWCALRNSCSSFELSVRLCRIVMTEGSSLAGWGIVYFTLLTLLPFSVHRVTQCVCGPSAGPSIAGKERKHDAFRIR